MYDLNALPRFGKGPDCKLVGKLVDGDVKFWFEKFAASHDDGCEEEGASFPDIVDGMQSGIEEIDERVEAKKKAVKEVGYFLVVDHTCVDGILESRGGMSRCADDTGGWGRRRRVRGWRGVRRGQVLDDMRLVVFWIEDCLEKRIALLPD